MKRLPLFLSLIVLLVACRTAGRQPATAVAEPSTSPAATPTAVAAQPSPITPAPSPASTSTPTAVPESAGSLVYSAYFGGRAAGQWDQENFNAYRESRPGLETRHIGFSLYTAPVPQMLYGRLERSGTADVFSSFAGGGLRPYMADGRLLDLSQLWEEQGWDEVFPASVQAYLREEGRPYFVPQAMQWNPIWYRADIFARHDLTPPQTWEEFLAACDTLHDAGIIPVTVSSTGWTPPLARWFTILNLRLNGPAFHEALMRGEVAYDDPRVRDVFLHWQELFTHNCFEAEPVGYGEAADQIFTGEAAMYNLGEWLSESYPEGLPDSFDFFSFPVLNPDVPRAEIVLLYGAYIPAGAQNPDQALDFITYLGGVESQTSNARALNRLVANTAVDPTLYSELYRRGLVFIENAEAITQLYEFNTHPAMAEAGLRAFSDFFRDPSEETIDEILAELEATRQQTFEGE